MADDPNAMLAALLGKLRSVVRVDGYREPEGIFNNRVIDRRNPFMSQSGNRSRLDIMRDGGTEGVRLPTYAVPTPQADKLSGERPSRWWQDDADLPTQQDLERRRIGNMIKGRFDRPMTQPGLSPDPKDAELRQFVAQRLGSDQPDPPASGVASFLSHLLGGQ